MRHRYCRRSELRRSRQRRRFLRAFSHPPKWQHSGNAHLQFLEKATDRRQTMGQKWLLAIIVEVRNYGRAASGYQQVFALILARKTKCDGGHPTCSSCARRSLNCNYVNDPNAPGGPRRKGSTAASEPSTISSGPVSAGPSSATASTSSVVTGYNVHDERERERIESQPPSKRIRVEGGSTSSPVPVVGIP